jgi:transposase
MSDNSARYLTGTARGSQEAREAEMISPHRSNRRKLKTQDGRRLRRYERRWLVERFFAWLQWQRRLLVRWEFYARNFLGFVQLASISILLRRF